MNIHFETRGEKDTPVIFWGHGWGQSHQSFLPLAGSFEGAGRHVLVDFPGFGKSTAPPESWGTAEYADALAALIRAQTDRKIIWIGHSFGGRVGIQLAARHPDLVRGLFLISAAGLPRKRPLWQKLYFKIRVSVFKLLRKMIRFGVSESWLMNTFASPDYKNAGPMRTIFVRVVNENLSETAQAVQCPVVLVYGSQDTETPPEIGERYKALIKNAEMVHLEGLDHYSVLSGGRHQVTPHLKRFLEELS